MVYMPGGKLTKTKKAIFKYAVSRGRKAIGRLFKYRPRFFKSHDSAYASSLQPHMFRNSLEVTLSANAVGTSGTGYGRTFKADDIGDISTIMALFDQYRIHSITVRYIPAWNSAGNTSNANAPMYVVTDPTDGTAPASASVMLDYARVRVFNAFKKWEFTFTPSFMQSIGVTSSNEYCTKPSTDFWMTNTDTIAYGLRIWVDPVGVNSAPIGTLIYTYNILARFES